MVVVDHNDVLLERARVSFPHGVEVVPNDDVHGLAGARNTGVRWATGDVVAFLDDDAVADPDWLATMLEQYRNHTVAGVGGVAEASWPAGVQAPVVPSGVRLGRRLQLPRPAYVVAPVRNPIGASMSLRRSLFHALGGFDTAMGRVGTTPLGCEETEFAVRARQHIAGVEFLHVPGAIVHHLVAPERHPSPLLRAAVPRRGPVQGGAVPPHRVRCGAVLGASLHDGDASPGHGHGRGRGGEGRSHGTGHAP